MDTRTTYYCRYDPGLADPILHFYAGVKGRLHVTESEHLFYIQVSRADASKILFSMRETLFYHGEDGVLSLLRDIYRKYVRE